MIKWLAEIVVSDTETDNWYHVNDNKVLPAGVDEERAAKEGETVSASVVLLKEYYHMVHFCLVLFFTCHCASMQTFQKDCCFKPKSGFRCHCQTPCQVIKCSPSNAVAMQCKLKQLLQYCITLGKLICALHTKQSVLLKHECGHLWHHLNILKCRILVEPRFCHQ